MTDATIQRDNSMIGYVCLTTRFPLAVALRREPVMAGLGCENDLFKVDHNSITSQRTVGFFDDALVQ